MNESRITISFLNWSASIAPPAPDTSSAAPAATLPGGALVSPAAIWASGFLYEAYYVGEILGVFGLTDAILEQWQQGSLPGLPEQAVTLLERIGRKQDHRVSAEARAKLYRGVFQLEMAVMIPETGAKQAASHSFLVDWDHLMRSTAAYSWQEGRGEYDAAQRSSTAIMQATRELQNSISEAMAGSAYIQSAEIASQLHESLELLRCAGVAEAFGVPGAGLEGMIAWWLGGPGTFTGLGVSLPVETFLGLASSGRRVLQEWVAAYDPRLAMDGRLGLLIEPAGAWNAAWAALPMDGGLSGRASGH